MRLTKDKHAPIVYCDLRNGEGLTPNKHAKAIRYALDHEAHTVEIHTEKIFKITITIAEET